MEAGWNGCGWWITCGVDYGFGLHSLHVTRHPHLPPRRPSPRQSVGSGERSSAITFVNRKGRGGGEASHGWGEGVTARTQRRRTLHTSQPSRTAVGT